MKQVLVITFLIALVTSLAAYINHSMTYCAKPICTISYLDYSENSHTVEKHYIWKNANFPGNWFRFLHQQRLQLRSR